jgi:glycosyltransferase involved in cell wall biosynthesis
MITLSTVTPIYRGEKYLRQLVEQLERVRHDWQKDQAPISLYESIFVDDNSIDGSKFLLQELAESRPWIRIVTLSRNFGQHSATIAGICHSQGDWIVTLDEDMQHDPGHIEAMLKQAACNNADLVYANPLQKVHGGGWRDHASVWTKKILARLSGIKAMPLFNSFRLIRGGIARAAASSGSSHTYLDVAFTWFTCSISSLDISMHDERYTSEGKSGYSLLKLIDHARKLILSSNVDFAKWGVLLGLASIVFSVFLASWVFVGYFIFPQAIQAPGWASLLATVALFSGAIIGLITLTLEYVSILLVNQLGKPVFFTVDRSSDAQLLNWFESKDVSRNNLSG